MGDKAAIIEMIEELQEMIMQYTNGELPPDYRIGDQTGEEAYLRVIYNPLMDIESTLHGLETDHTQDIYDLIAQNK